MAIAFGAISGRTSAQTGTSVAVSGSNTIGIILTQGNVSATNSITAITWGGVSMTLIDGAQVPSDRYMSAWYVLNPSSSGAISMTGGAFWDWYSWYYTGALQSGQVDSTNHGTSSASTTITVATTVVASNCWTVMCQADGVGNVTYSTNVGVMRLSSSPTSQAISDSNGTVGTGSQSTTLTRTGTSGHAGVNFSIAPFVVATVNSSFFAFM